MYKRVLIKLSGEALAGSQKTGLDHDTVHAICASIKKIYDLGTEVAIVVGGGNFWRGRSSGEMDRTRADHIGMLATAMNALALADALEQEGCDVRVQTAISMQQVAVGVVLLSALGAVMDTALSVTSAVYEVAVHRKDLDRSAYFRSGIEVGKEIIGTTVNTLVFAYLGESLMLFAYLEKNGYSPEMMLNSKVLFQNIAVMLLGIIACLLSVPVAAYLVAWKVGQKGEEDK